MTDIIQIFKYKELFTKENYTPKNRKQLAVYPKEVISEQGYWEAEKVVLPLAQKENLKAKPDLLIIQDLLQHEFVPNESWTRTPREAFRTFAHQGHYTFYQLQGFRSFELFKLQKAAEDRYELFLDYQSNSATIGVPRRQDHKLCDLRPGAAVRIRINGRSDFTLFGRKARSFHEFDYLIQWRGTTDKIAFQDPARIKNIKQLPQEFSTTVDERKPL